MKRYQLLGRLLGILLLILTFAPRAHAADATQEYTISSGGIDRTYLLHRPPSLDAHKPVPLVIMMHGGFGNGAQAEKSYGWDTESDRGGFVVAFPDGYHRSWNAGGTCCGKANSENIDDITFLTQLIQDVAHHQAIDPKRVYMTGMSNGAAMSYYYACKGPFPIAAIGPVSGSLAAPCTNPHATSIMEIHGLDDKNIPFTGGRGSKGVSKVEWLGVPDTLGIFRKAMNCPPAVASADKGPVHAMTSMCDGGNEVSLISISGVGHQWPGSEAPRTGLLGLLFSPDPPSQDMHATPMLWQFFQRHSAP